jgi:two-component system chemotaxis response regulator CheB
MEEPIKVLIVDDALFMRKAISEILSTDQKLKIVGTAKDGVDGLEKIKELKPDVVTLDIDMPRMDGLSAIRHIMIQSPVPVVVLSSLFSDGAVTFEALRLGVVDFVPKPSGAITENIDQSRRMIIERVKVASSVNFENIRRVRLRPADPNEVLSSRYGFYPLEYLVTIGTTLSGPNTIIRLLSRLSPVLPAALVVMQEIAPQILPSFVRKFNERVSWKIEIASDGQVLEQGACYIGSNEYSLRIGQNDYGQPCLHVGQRVDKPLDMLFASAADIFKSNAIGVLLTGIGDDGAQGFSKIRSCNGVTIAQNAECCVYPNLTQHAIEMGTVTEIVVENKLPDTIAATAA